jgi:hypothetical protein
MGAGDWGKVSDKGETSNGLVGLPGRLVAKDVTIWGGPSERSGRAAAGSGWVTGGGRMLP